MYWKNEGLPIPRLTAKKISEAQSRASKKRGASLGAIASRTDFLQFRQYVCEQQTYEHMLVWHRLLNTGASKEDLINIAGDDICILAPRNSAKSTFLLQWLAWLIGVHAARGISLKVLYISYVIGVAANKSRQIKAIIESAKYREVFPCVRPSRGKWGENEWAIDFEFAKLRSIDEPYTLACSGLFGAINSKRAHLIIFDDLLKSKQEANSKPIQDKMVDNYYNVVRFTRYPVSRAINLGTRFAKYDINTRIFVQSNGWQQVEQESLIELPGGGFKSFCEPRGNLGITVDDLLREKAEDEDTFLLQRQNKLPTTETVGIKLNNIKRGWMPEQFDKLVMGFDIAVSDKKYSDFSAFILIGTKGESLYVIDGWQEKIKGNMRKIDVIYRLWDKWRHTCSSPMTLAIDKNRYSISIEGDLCEYRDASEDFFKALAVSSIPSTGRGSDKLDRLMAHSLLFEKGRITFNNLSSPILPGKGVTPLEQVILEITDYNPLDHNDLMDALELAVYESRRVGGELSALPNK